MITILGYSQASVTADFLGMMTHAGLDDKLLAKVLVNGLRLGGRFHYHQRFAHCFERFLNTAASH